MFDDVINGGLHWRELEVRGVLSVKQTLRNSIKFVLFGLCGTALTLAVFHNYSSLDSSLELYQGDYINSVHDEDFKTARKTGTAMLWLSALFFSFV